MHSQNNSNSIAAIVLAAGKGTRMKSEVPKVLHKICGLPMVGHVVRTLSAAGIAEKCIVVGGDIDLLQTTLREFGELTYTLQKDRLGTGEAVACAGFGLEGVIPPKFASGSLLSGSKIKAKHVLVCAGDTPAMDPQIIAEFMETCVIQKTKLAVLGMNHPEPRGYGRLITDPKQQLVRIVEEKDANDAERKVNLCNSGVIFAETDHLFTLLASLTQANAQNEYYLTDCFALSLERGEPALVWSTNDYGSFDGVNDRAQLAKLEERMVAKIRDRWMAAGVSFNLASSSYIETEVSLGADTRIGSHASLMGQTSIGKGCEIGSHVALKNVKIPDGEVVPSGTVQIV